MEELQHFKTEQELNDFLDSHLNERKIRLNMRFKLRNDTPFDFQDIVFGWEYWGGGGEIGMGYRCYKYDELIKDYTVSKYVKIASCVFYYKDHNGQLRSFRCKDEVAPEGRYLFRAGWNITPKTDKGNLTGEIDIVPFEIDNDDLME